MKNETTNVGHVDPKIKACIAFLEAQTKEFNPTRSTEIAIREYLEKNPNMTIKVEENRPNNISKGKKETAKEGDTRGE